MGFSGLFGQQLDRLIGVYALAEIEEVAVLGLKLQIVLCPDKEDSLALNQGFEELAAAFSLVSDRVCLVMRWRNPMWWSLDFVNSGTQVLQTFAPFKLRIDPTDVVTSCGEVPFHRLAWCLSSRCSK